ncbi:hypothetical protein JQ581_31095 [Bradyrhizobium liaoningense]|uniref:hypothetical protein n=1 Tax=Bradyrhizobium liaoningense TaxID=43992 RepID=UPI001BAD88CF|nr:hypothetical protein [Bradyrhizobium liaoningense]MBR0741387.1 hypothetical protein [Bradyrhizobium liaoningense]
MNYDEFSKLPDATKIEARLSWLEWKMVDLLWLLIALTSMLTGILVAWLFSTVSGIGSLWVKIGLFGSAFLVVGWLLKRRAFKNAPAHIPLIDP